MKNTPLESLARAIVLVLVWSPLLSAQETDRLEADQTTTAVPDAQQIEFFEKKIRPLLFEHCQACHGEQEQEAELRLDTLAGILSGGKAGPAVIPEQPLRSLIITAVRYDDSDLRMPPEQKLSDRQIADLTRWVAMGTPHPDSGRTEVDRPRSRIDLTQARQHWAFQPPIASPLPSTDLASTAGSSSPNPIDAFIATALQQQGLKPLEKSDKRTLIRRATLDLTGLPPTPQQINAFLADDSAGAFARLVDRLLSSPEYGERWGRHWLDVARYADSNGLDENAAHGNAWRYRDYVIDAFNQDKPYNEFITEQLAGDLLDSGNDHRLRRERLTATGYLSLGPKVLAEVDEQKMEMDIIDEQIDTIGRGLMGLTLGCARCHDHKFDPLEHTDYYALAGIFKSTRTMESFKKVAKWNEISIAGPEDLALQQRHAQQVSDKQAQLDTLLREAKTALTPEQKEGQADTIEQRFPAATQQTIAKLREELQSLKASAPPMPFAMAVADGTVTDVSVHVRGSHLTLGEVVPRRFPRVLAGDEQPALPADRSGRLKFANWLTSADHPLTARVMVNRLWRWHFGKGLVTTVDNFGLQGARPSHPELLDWLAVQFIESDWSIKSMHRLIMLSETYQRSSRSDPELAQADPDNRWYGRFDVRRLEAEAIRDSLLMVSGQLDPTMGGRLLTTKNRTLVFNHTSEDKSDYNLFRRSIYLPVIRNHLYDMFQLFDYSDASVLRGSRDTSTIAPQALFLMNSQWMTERSTAMATRLIAAEPVFESRTTRLFEEALGRPPTPDETQQVKDFLTSLHEADPGMQEVACWQVLCQSILSSNEFLYVR